MKSRHRHLAAILLIFCFLASPALAQEAVSLKAEVDRTAISTDELLTLTVTVAGSFQQLGEPQLPLLSGFNVAGSSRSSQFSMVNGVVTARTIFTYRLQPSGAGTFSIDSITVLVDGSAYQTDALTVQVTQGTPPTPSPEPAEGASPEPTETPDQGSLLAPSPGELAGQDFFVQADIDNPTPFVGQQIIYRFRFFQAVNLFAQPQLDWPAFSGFWSESLTPNQIYEQTIAGRLYRITNVRQALFPTAAGQTTIQPATLTIPGDFFSRDTELQTESVGVNVRPLPAGAPDDFIGAVGRFEIKSWVEPVEARVNEPVTLFVQVRGSGNLTALPDPTEESDALLAQWRVYDPQTTTNVGQDGDTIQGEKLLERLLVPKIEGNLQIPPFTLTFFDSEVGEYRQIETEPLTVQVAPGDAAAPSPSNGGNSKQDIKLLAGDIRHIKTSPPSLLAHRARHIEKPLYWLGWLSPGLALVGVWVWEHRRRQLSSDIAYARAQRAHRAAKKQLSQARKLARQDEDVARAAVARALSDYFGDKFNLFASGLTRDVIRRALSTQSIPDQLIDRSLACLDWADSGRFAPVDTGRDTHDTDELIAEAESIIAGLEQCIHTT